MTEVERTAADEITAYRRDIAEDAVDRQYELQPGLWESFGPEGYRKAVRDAVYHLEYLSEAVRMADPSLFLSYIDWLRILFRSIGLPEDALHKALICSREAIDEVLPRHASEAAQPYIDSALRHLEEPAPQASSHMEAGAPLSGLAGDFLRRLLDKDLRSAGRLVLDAVENGTPVKDIYLHVFQRSQHEIGRLWQTNRITVAEEHYCTAATQLIMSRLYPRIFSTDRCGRRLVAACVGGELHEIGIRMVADFFEMDGWDTYYIGANTPAESIAAAAEEQEADVLALSATMIFHLRLLRDIIDRVRAAGRGDVKILVGGYPFNVSGDLWKKVGGDGSARDAQEAVRAAERLVGRVP